MCDDSNGTINWCAHTCHLFSVKVMLKNKHRYVFTISICIEFYVLLGDFTNTFATGFIGIDVDINDPHNVCQCDSIFIVLLPIIRYDYDKFIV